MRIDAYIVNNFIKLVFCIVCSIDRKDLEKVPEKGPLIIVSNHTNFIEVPVLYTHLMPRPITGFAKAEGWKNPFLHYLADLWGAIPLHRGEADVSAIRRALTALKNGKIVGVAPEGTRSGDGHLRRGHPGVVILALQSGAPLLPLVFHGSEDYLNDWKKLRKTAFNITVGNSFFLNGSRERVTNAIRQEMVDEIMYQLAALLPAANRGYYSDLNKATEQFLSFPPGSHSNLFSAQEPTIFDEVNL